MPSKPAQNAPDKIPPAGLARYNRLAWALLLWLPIIALLLLASQLPGQVPQFVARHVHYSLLGITGAIFANTTGAGGGVVFIPVFAQLQFSDVQAVATSFAIQSFGMTAGACCWWLLARAEQRNHIHAGRWDLLAPLTLVCGVVSVLGLWCQYGGLVSAQGWSLRSSFSIFSVLLGLLLLLSLALRPSITLARSVHPADWLALGLISLGGGWLTASLSVGVGELLATYLILRRFDVKLAVAVAVCVSAITVWAALPQHLLVNPNIAWQVLVFAGPGALLGGMLAPRIATWLPVRKLKLVFACWVLLTGLFGVF